MPTPKRKAGLLTTTEATLLSVAASGGDWVGKGQVVQIRLVNNDPNNEIVATLKAVISGADITIAKPSLSANGGDYNETCYLILENGDSIKGIAAITSQVNWLITGLEGVS